MLSLNEVSRGITGAWLLAKGKREAMAVFDVSLGGFWRSFAAVFLILPIYVATMFAQRAVLISDTPLTVDTFPDNAFFIGNTIGLFLDWLAFPIVTALLARPLGFADRYVPFMVARNWTSVLAIIPYSVPILLYSLGIISAELTTLFTLVAIFAVLYYRFMATRISLDANVSLAVGLVVLDLVLSLLLGEAINRLIGFSG
ncbi:MAG: hypothetical protein C0606_06785 [Hyphomicrobiales bacterium]|nr:MAG: hypothetical protein C0606_06785 [Hyphomicrobiales bacterium]